MGGFPCLVSHFVSRPDIALMTAGCLNHGDMSAQDELRADEPPVTLAEFARMAAALNTGNRRLDSFLDRFSVSRSAWLRISAYWMEIITQDAEAGSRFSALLQEEMRRQLQASGRLPEGM